MNKMLKPVKIIVIILFVAVKLSIANGNDSTQSYLNHYVVFNFGYTYNSLDESRKFFREVIESYQASGINMPFQVTYPFSRVLGASVSLEINKKIRLGVEYLTTNTKAFSLYSDKNGRLDLTSTITSEKVGATCEFTLMRLGPYYKIGMFSPFIQIGTGVVTIYYDLFQKISYIPYQEEVSNKITARGSSLYFDMYIGMNQTIHYPELSDKVDFIVFEKIGYHISKATDARSPYHKPMNLSGVSLEFGMGIIL